MEKTKRKVIRVKVFKKHLCDKKEKLDIVKYLSPGDSIRAEVVVSFDALPEILNKNFQGETLIRIVSKVLLI